MLLRRPANDRRHFDSRRSPASRRPPGAVLLLLSIFTAAAAFSLALPTAHAIYCDRLAPLSVLAVLAAALLALGFRALSVTGRRSVLYAALLLSAASLFVSARFVARYHSACNSVQQQLRQLHSAS